jgi:hypothetical protein
MTTQWLLLTRDEARNLITSAILRRERFRAMMSSADPTYRVSSGHNIAALDSAIDKLDTLLRTFEDGDDGDETEVA